MTISVWRYSHLTLALSSFLIIALAAITGIILAFEPVAIKQQPYKVANFDQVTLATAIPAIKNNFEEVTSLTVDHNQFVVVKGITTDGKDVTVYVDPRTGKTLGVPTAQSEFFQWVTAFHRSLFLKEIGRFFIGFTTFLLFLITISGSILIIQRQRGIKHFFAKIVKENFFQYYHVTLGRLLLIPILIIAISGTYLSLVRFNLIPEGKIAAANIDFEALKIHPERKLADFKFFKETPLSQVQSIEFPFSTDVEDYYTFKLKDSEVTVNQLTGDVLSETPYSMAALLVELSLNLHTGRTNAIWAIILGFACLNIMFFIYSGFAITLKRIGGKVKNKYKPEDAEFLILVGSENGSTNHFAKAIYEQLLKAGQKCFITELNNYNVFPKAKHIIIFSATYGLGDPPTNATRFLTLLKKYPQPNKVDFSVVGFGSKSYPDYCKYAFEINNALLMEDWAVPLVEIHTVNDKSPDEFGAWAALWSQKTAIPLVISPDLIALKSRNLSKLTVVSKTAVAHQDGSFLIHLQPSRNLSFKSGDLLAIYPADDHRERLYSIGKIDKALQLSVKLHPNGLGSSYLYGLTVGNVIKAEVQKNPHFYFPKKASTVIMIANGTGIAPFLGMIAENNPQVAIHLYCGFRDSSSFALYEKALDVNLADRKLAALHLAYSREGAQQYVSDLVLRDQDFIANAMAKDAVIMICGSLAMQKDITELLAGVFKEKNNQELSDYQSHGRLLMDCY